MFNVQAVNAKLNAVRFVLIFRAKQNEICFFDNYSPFIYLI